MCLTTQIVEKRADSKTRQTEQDRAWGEACKKICEVVMKEASWLFSDIDLDLAWRIGVAFQPRASASYCSKVFVDS